MEAADVLNATANATDTCVQRPRRQAAIVAMENIRCLRKREDMSESSKRFRECAAQIDAEFDAELKQRCVKTEDLEPEDAALSSDDEDDEDDEYFSATTVLCPTITYPKPVSTCLARKRRMRRRRKRTQTRICAWTRRARKMKRNTTEKAKKKTKKKTKKSSVRQKRMNMSTSDVCSRRGRELLQGA